MANSPNPPSRKNRIAVDLKDLHTPWSTWCQMHNLVPSEALRRVVRKVVETASDRPNLPPDADFGDDEKGPRQRVEVRLTGAELRALTAAADAEGMSVPRWLGAFLRLHLTQEPQFNSTEIAALSRSNQLLLALGRNVNQIAHNISARTDTDELSLEQIKYLTAFVKKHTAEVSALIHANGRRWRR